MLITLKWVNNSLEDFSRTTILRFQVLVPCSHWNFFAQMHILFIMYLCIVILCIVHPCHDYLQSCIEVFCCIFCGKSVFFNVCCCLSVYLSKHYKKARHTITTTKWRSYPESEYAIYCDDLLYLTLTLIHGLLIVQEKKQPPINSDVAAFASRAKVVYPINQKYRVSLSYLYSHICTQQITW